MKVQNLPQKLTFDPIGNHQDKNNKKDKYSSSTIEKDLFVSKLPDSSTVFRQVSKKHNHEKIIKRIGFIAVLGLTMYALSSIRKAVAQRPQCAEDDFACWDAAPEPIDIYSELQQAVSELNSGRCPFICYIQRFEVERLAQVVNMVGGLFCNVFQGGGRIACKMARIAAAAYGYDGTRLTREAYEGIVRHCLQRNCTLS